MLTWDAGWYLDTIASLLQRFFFPAGQQSTRQLVAYFQIGSRRTIYKILRLLEQPFNQG